MSESNIMMVNPNEIVIDMPVDEQNVLQKMESMKERGVIQPVTLWLQGMRVIDGFHRSVAAQRLGWNEIPCYVVDCNEDAFWDARIQSARQHHRIEDERLSAWVTESWRSTEWYKPELIDPSLLGMYHQSPEYLSLVETLWIVYRKHRLQNSSFCFDGLSHDAYLERMKRYLASPDGTDPRYEGITDWLNAKARRWGIHPAKISDIILESSPMHIPGIDFIVDKEKTSMTAAPDRLAAEKDLSLAERQKIAKYLTAPNQQRKHYDYQEIKDWAEAEVINGEKEDPTPFADSLRLKRDSQLRDQALRQENELQFLQTPQGQAEAHKRKVQTVKEAMSRVAWTAESVDHLIADSPDFSLPVAEAIATLTAFHNEHFKRKDTKIKDLVTARNAQLRREIKALTEKVESLERALNTKQAVTPRLKNVMVEHAQ